MLHTPRGAGRFCGPTAMMAVTGASWPEVSDAIHEARGRRMTAAGRRMPVMGMVRGELVAAMAELGWFVADHKPEAVWNCQRRVYTWPRFHAFLAEHPDGGPFIVATTGHYIAVAGGEICDSCACPLPTAIDKYLARKKPRYLGSWVKEWWR